MSEINDAWRRQRLQELATKFGSNAELGRRLGYVDGAYVRQMIAGERPITEKTIQKAEALPESKGWFAQAVDGLVREATKGYLVDKEPEVTLVHYAAGGAMGKGLILQGEQPGIIRNMIVTREWAQKNLRSHTGLQNLCIVTGFGDSMKPLFNPGDPLIVDQGVKACEVDAVYFFRVGEEGFIKRLQRVPGEGVWALSANKEYKDWLIQKDADFEVFGRVLKAWKSEDL